MIIKKTTKEKPHLQKRNQSMQNGNKIAIIINNLKKKPVVLKAEIQSENLSKGNIGMAAFGITYHRMSMLITTKKA